jgi:hypothetical protein
MYHHPLVCISEIPKHTWGHCCSYNSSLFEYLQGISRCANVDIWSMDTEVSSIMTIWINRQLTLP